MLACPVEAHAQNAGFGTSLEEAIAQKNWEAADRILEQAQADPSADPYALSFVTGIVAIERGQYPRAIAVFRETLTTRPELTRVRLELARALFLAGDHDVARMHFERVLGGDVPAAVAANVRRYLAAMRQKRPWTFDLSVGYLADSNANSGTAQDVVSFFGVPRCGFYD